MSKLFFEGVISNRQELKNAPFYPLDVDCQVGICKIDDEYIFGGKFIEVQTDGGPVLLMLRGVMYGRAACWMNWIDASGKLQHADVFLSRGALVRLANKEERRRD